MQPRDDVERLLKPTGTALVGGLDRAADPAKLRAQLHRRWGESFHLVDPAGGSIGDIPVYTTLAEVPDPGRPRRAQRRSQPRRRGGRGVRPARRSQPDRHHRRVRGARRRGSRARSPDRRRMAAVTSPAAARKMPAAEAVGKIALVTQSSHMGRVIFQSSAHGVAFSRWAPTGNEANLEAANFIEYFAYADETAVIACYIEGFRDGAKLRRALAAADAAQDTPVVVIEVGRQEAATRMASSHTAHLTGSDAVIDGLFRQYRVLRVEDVDELIETAALHAKLAPEPKGDRVVLYGISGGAVALMAEQAQSHHVAVPVLSEQTQERLHEILPAHLGVSNPVDNGSLYRNGTEEQRRRIFELMCADPSVDVCSSAADRIPPRHHRRLRRRHPRLHAFQRDAGRRDLEHLGDGRSRPTRHSSRAACRSSGASAAASRRWPATSITSGAPSSRARARPTRLQPSGRARGQPSARSTPRRPRRCSAPASPWRRSAPVGSSKEAAEAAAELGFPVVLKAPLPDFPHKSDVGLVRTAIESAAEAAAAYGELEARGRELAPGLDRVPDPRPAAGAGGRRGHRRHHQRPDPRRRAAGRAGRHLHGGARGRQRAPHPGHAGRRGGDGARAPRLRPARGRARNGEGRRGSADPRHARHRRPLRRRPGERRSGARPEPRHRRPPRSRGRRQPDRRRGLSRGARRPGHAARDTRQPLPALLPYLTFAAFSAARTRAGVNGAVRIRTPVASKNAFATAAAAATATGSPTPAAKGVGVRVPLEDDRRHLRRVLEAQDRVADEVRARDVRLAVAVLLDEQAADDLRDRRRRSGSRPAGIDREAGADRLRRRA